MASPRAALMAWFASQLGHPHGLASALVARVLNRTNAAAISKAVDAAGLGEGDVAADVGFGGGLGLQLMLQKVGLSGKVYGIDVSADMVSRAARQFRKEVEDGRLILDEGSLTRLPLEGGTVDGAITVNTVYFIADLAPAFAELVRVLRPGGRVVLGIGDPDSMARMPMTSYGFRLRPIDEIVGAARASGLELRSRVQTGDGIRARHVLTFSCAG